MRTRRIQCSKATARTLGHKAPVEIWPARRDELLGHPVVSGKAGPGRIRANRSKLHMTYLIFACTVTNREVVTNEEFEEYLWVEPQNLDDCDEATKSFFKPTTNGIPEQSSLSIEMVFERLPTLVHGMGR